MSKSLLESLLPISEELQMKINENTILYETHNTEMLVPTNDTLYSAIIPTGECLDELSWWVGTNELADKMIQVGGKFYSKDDYHTTLVYSKTTGAQLYNYLVEHAETILKNTVATVKGITFFGNCCALLLDAPYLQDLNVTLKAIGATSDFPDYNPHITLFKLPDEVSPDDKAWFEEWLLPQLGLKPEK